MPYDSPTLMIFLYIIGIMFAIAILFKIIHKIYKFKNRKKKGIYPLW